MSIFNGIYVSKSKAEKLVCPFISNCVGTATDAGEYLISCSTDKCMAWVDTSTESDKEHNVEQGYCKRLCT